MIKVVLCDDHVIFRQGLLKLLQSAEDIIVVGESGDGNEVLNLILREKPDLAILDISMPGLSGFEIAEKIQKSGLETKIIFLTMHNDQPTVKTAIQSDASGFVLKDDAFEDLLYAIRAVASGGKFISPSLSAEFFKAKPPTEIKYHNLTEREREILRLIALGLTNKKIAEKLCISVKTVETHRTNILQKLNIHSTADLVRNAIKMGLLEP
jgi:DNA-binding NarL/FixJ family response regulator